MIRRLIICMSLLVLMPGGCAEKQIDQAFQDVQATTNDRLGHELIWLRSTAAEEKAARELGAILESELDADLAVHIALLNNRRLQASYSEIGVAAAQLVEAWLIRNPVLTGQIRFAHGRPLYEMEIVQNFLDVLLLPLRVPIAEAQLEASKSRVTAQVIEVACDTRRTFYRYQARLELLHYWQGLLVAAESSYEMALQLRRAGNISELRLAREQAMYEQLKMDLAETELAAVRDRERLNILMGLWGAATAWRARAELPELPEANPELDGIERQAIENSLDLQVALYNLTAEARRLGLDTIEAVVPQLGLGVAVESERPTEYRLDRDRRRDRTEYELKERTVDEWQAGPHFEVPIPVWNWGQAAYATGRMEILRRWNLYTALAINIRASARAAEFRMRAAHQRARFARQLLVPVWDNVFEQTHLQYNAMFLGVFDLLRAKEDQLRAHQRYVKALAEYWDARTDMEQLLLGSSRRASEFEQEDGAVGFSAGMQGTLSMIERQAGSSREAHGGEPRGNGGND